MDRHLPTAGHRRIASDGRQGGASQIVWPVIQIPMMRPGRRDPQFLD